MSRILERLPRGRTLPDETWAARHRIMVWLLWLHTAGLGIFAAALGHSVVHSVLDALPVALFALIAREKSLGRRARASAVALGLLTASAMLVHLWGGRIEAHFHFFVMVTVLALYEEWIPYLLAIGYVVAHHGAAGLLDPRAVYDHPGGETDPWLWAAIHGGFISALAAANVVSWRLNEDVRDSMRHSETRFRSAFDDAPIGMALLDLDGRIRRVNRVLSERCGYNEAELQEMHLTELLAPEAREAGREWPRPDLEGAPEQLRFVRRDGTTGWAQWQHSILRGSDGEPASFITHVIEVPRPHAGRGDAAAPAQRPAAD